MSKRNVSLQTLKSQLAKSTLALGLVVSSQTTQAQDSIQTEDLIRAYDLTGVVISATRTEQKPDDVGRSITIIDSTDISNSVHGNVSELLSAQEGIYIVGAGQNPGSLQNIFMRGANPEHTVILMDGVRISDPSSTDNGINLAELSLANVERIEVVRGSHSTLYGSSAIGGVINIITKKGGKKGINASTSVSGGTFGDQTTDLSQDVSLCYTFKKGLYVSGEVFNRNVNGIDATTDTITDLATYNERDNDGFDKLDAIGKLGFKNDKWDVFGYYKSTQQTSDIDDGAYRDDDNYTVDFHRNLIGYQSAYKVNKKVNLKFSGGYTDMRRTAFDDSSQVTTTGIYDHAISESNYEGTTSNNELQADFKFKHAALVFGGGNYGQTMTANTMYEYKITDPFNGFESNSDLDTLDIKTNTASAFAHVDLAGGLVSKRFSSLSIALGVRYNNHSVYGDNFTYEINPSFKLSNKSLMYGSFSTGFNAPALYRLYSPNLNATSNITRGNVDLNPETSTSIELGIKQKAGENTFFTFSIFQTKVEDLIEYVYLWDKSIGIDTLGNDYLRPDYHGDTYINIGSQTNTGFEFGISTMLSKKISLKANISLVEGKLNYKPDNTDFTDNHHVQLFTSGTFLTKEVDIQGLTRRSNTANINLGYKATEKLAFNADLRYAGQKSDVAYDANLGPYGALGKTSVGGYSLIGLGIRYTIIKNLIANFSVDNLMDLDYQEINGYATRGRGFYLKLNYTL